MPDLPWEHIVTVYGPLGLGWPIAVWAIWRNERVMNQMLQVVRDNTAALSMLSEQFRWEMRSRGQSEG